MSQLALSGLILITLALPAHSLKCYVCTDTVASGPCASLSGGATGGVTIQDGCSSCQSVVSTYAGIFLFYRYCFIDPAPCIPMRLTHSNVKTIGVCCKDKDLCNDQDGADLTNNTPAYVAPETIECYSCVGTSDSDGCSEVSDKSATMSKCQQCQTTRTGYADSYMFSRSCITSPLTCTPGSYSLGGTDVTISCCNTARCNSEAHAGANKGAQETAKQKGGAPQTGGAVFTVMMAVILALAG